MPRGGARVGAGRPRKGAAPKAKATGASAPPVATGLDLPEGESPGDKEPLAYMLSVMNDPNADASRRDRMAVAAAPFLHKKLGEGGKKDNAKDSAEKAGTGRFAPAAAPPRLVHSR